MAPRVPSRNAAACDYDDGRDDIAIPVHEVQDVPEC